MDMELKGDQGSFTFPQKDWGNLLMMAMRAGWKPAGTTSPTMDEKWNGTYFTSEGQLVAAEDAKSLAGALETALSQIKDDQPNKPKPVEAVMATDRTMASSDWFVGPNDKERIRGLIEFCQAGWFTIG